MTARFGNVIYWVACALAAGWAVLSYFGTTSQAQPDWDFFWIGGIGVAVVIWAIGRGFRYILSST